MVMLALGGNEVVMLTFWGLGGGAEVRPLSASFREAL
jgi:hypothetical protein